NQTEKIGLIKMVDLLISNPAWSAPTATGAGNSQNPGWQQMTDAIANTQADLDSIPGKMSACSRNPLGLQQSCLQQVEQEDQKDQHDLKIYKDSLAKINTALCGDNSKYSRVGGTGGCDVNKTPYGAPGNTGLIAERDKAEDRIQIL